MTWGNAFRSAWEHGTTAGRTAAREAALSPDKAAGLLSDAIGHTLQRVIYAAQDLQRIQVAGAQPGETVVPGAATLRRVMEDIRQGRIAPERSEKHLQQAARAVVEQAKSPGAMPADDVAHSTEIRLASQRFQTLRQQLIEQMIASHQRMMEQGARPDRSEKLVGVLHNVDLSARLTQAFATIDQLFLENKPVDDPAVPLPSCARSIETDIGVSCLPPRA